MKPLIGINVDIEGGPPPHMEVQTTYVAAIQQAGGIPILLPPMNDEDLEQVFARLSGLLLIGGRDYCPTRYGQDPEPCIELTHPLREDFDFRLLKKVLTGTDLPILGVCAGAQLLNIIKGGTLIQDIPTEFPDSQVKHSRGGDAQNGYHKHLVKIEKNSFLSQFYTEDVEVPTSHHQAVGKLGDGLRAVAFAEDGIIEAIELPGRPFTVGVQWHPERDILTSNKLFSGFVKACQSLKKVPEVSSRKAG
jgi:putative glutamine amidotransferase